MLSSVMMLGLVAHVPLAQGGGGHREASVQRVDGLGVCAFALHLLCVRGSGVLVLCPLVCAGSSPSSVGLRLTGAQFLQHMSTESEWSCCMQSAPKRS